MAHEVRLKIDDVALQNSDLEITIKTNTMGKQGKLGTLLISKGNIEWLPSGHSVTRYRLPWVKFAEFMKKSGDKARKS